MSFNRATSILEKYLSKEGGLLDITFYGGETLLVFDTIQKIVEWAISRKWNRKFMFFGCTNGTLLTDDIKNWLRQHSQIFTLGLSFDGIPEIQKENRGNENIDIDFFIKTWPQQQIQMTINEKSISKMYEGIIFLLNKGAKVHPNVAYEDYEWSDDALNSYGFQLYKLIDFYEKNPSYPVVNQFKYDLIKLASDIGNPPIQTRACGAGNGFYLYDHDGNHYPCHILSPLVIGRNNIQTCLESFNKETNFADNMCLECPFISCCSTCMACNYIYRNSFNRRDRTHCKITKLEIRATIRREVNRLLHKDKLTPYDATLADVIPMLLNYLK